jgi:adenine-specific DNA-methyltransferase
MKFKDLLLELLKTDNRLLDSEGELMGNKIQDLADKTDEKLIELLLDNSETRLKFFLKIKDVFVFKTSDFKFYLDENKIDNSYTQYENRIGLTSNGKFLKDSNDIVLDFPYKDCILEGGQSTEEGTDTYFEWNEKDQHYIEKQAKRKEIFFNNVLAKDEIDRLLEPKAFTNAKKYSLKGVENLTKFERDEHGTIKDNLIIKGNNLLALHTLKKEFAGKVKLIYIDPPYNTGNDSFAYNDNFNHSTWLTFMRNRLLVAKELLREDGVIFVHCDDNEQAYLKILMDEIYNRINFDSCITSIVKTEGRRYGNLAKTHEYILLYAKNKDFTKIYEVEKDNHKFKYIDNIGEFDLTDLRNQNAAAFNSKNRPNLRYPFYVDLNSKDLNGLFRVAINKVEGFEVVFPTTINSTESVWRWGKEKATENQKSNIVARRSNDGIFRIFQKYRSSTTMEKTVWFDKNYISNKGTKELDELFKGKVFGFPKPEFFMKKIIELSTKENDIVLDYHLGSGTTSAVAHKMNRQYIGIEQMDYVETVAVERLKKVIDGEQGGISKSVNWQGGGSFVYLELAKNNQKAVEQIQNCKSYKELTSFFDEMCEKYFLHYNVKVKQFREGISKEDNFKKLSLDNQKELFIKMLDLNQLYVNVSDMKDHKHNLSDNDIAVTKDFYQL